MKRFIVFFVLALNFFSVYSQNLSKKAEIYVLTCSPGNELYQAFGHNAIWIIDSLKDINMVYHYGTFDFSTPHFYIKFIRGRLNYMLALEPYRYFIAEYASDGRDVYKEKLNLTYDEKNSIYKYLTWKSLPENKYYKYDFFNDNCATRIRDVLEKIFPNSLQYPDLKIKKTYRQAIKPYLRARPWTRFGINLLLGLPADKELDVRTAMFLPDYVDTVLLKTKIITSTITKPLVLSRSYMIRSNYKIGPKPFFNPTLFFWLLFVAIAIVSYFELKKKKKYKIIDFVIYFVTGVSGIILLFMWFGTDHSATKENLNVIWAFPVHLWIAFVYLKGKRLNLLKYYSLIFAIVNLALVVLYPLFPQHFDIALIPLFLMMSMRFFKEYYELRY
jgi:hypothetical protein